MNDSARRDLRALRLQRGRHGAGLYSSIRLDGVRPDDVDILSGWMNDLEDLRLWTARRRHLLYEDLYDPIRERCRVGLFTVIRDTGTGKPLGFIDGTLHERDNVAEFELYLPEESRLRGAIRGAVQFIGHLFTNYPLRKLFCQVYEYNTATKALLSTAGFVEEARFRNFTWWRDRYWDVHVFVLDRETWDGGEGGNGRLGRLWRLLEKRGDTEVLFGMR